MREKEREKESERERGKGKRGEGKERRMCEQQRCISVQRSIHRVEVNARPYSGSRKERKGGRVGGSREEGALRGRERGRAEGTGAEWKKMNKHPVRNGGGELPRSAPVRTLSSFPFFLSYSPLSLSLSFPLFSSSLSLFLLVVTLPRLSLSFALRCTGFLLPERFPLNVKIRTKLDREKFFLLPLLVSVSLRETYFESAHVYNKGSLRSMR